uniref:Activin_recp domain-containing protein n=1 Tax=Parastrongyloides trichosuri TaxID=131310 RepID=A0A0N4Z5A6_PARTI
MNVQFLVSFFLFIQTFEEGLQIDNDVTYCYIGDDSEKISNCSSNWCYTYEDKKSNKIIDRGCDNEKVFCNVLGNSCQANLTIFFNNLTWDPDFSNNKICCCNKTLCNTSSRIHLIKHSMTKILSLFILLIYLLTNFIL